MSTPICQSSRKAAARLLREPLVHFVLGGAALFALTQALAPAPDRTLVPDRIVIGTDDLNRIASAWAAQAGSPPPLEMLIALSILFLAPEILRQQNGGHSLSIGFPWIIAFAFGLLHGLGFATGLGAAGLPRDQILPALLAFNVGVEIGQLAFVGAVLLTLAAVRSLGVAWPRPIRLAPAYLVGVLGAF